MEATNIISDKVRNKEGRKNRTPINKFNLFLTKEQEGLLKRRIETAGHGSKAKYFRYLLFKDLDNGY